MSADGTFTTGGGKRSASKGRSAGKKRGTTKKKGSTRKAPRSKPASRSKKASSKRGGKGATSLKELKNRARQLGVAMSGLQRAVKAC
jgi:hypothetical protein